MKRIGFALVTQGKREHLQSWIGDWDNCPGIPSFIRIEGVQVHGIELDKVFSVGKKKYKVIEVLGSPEARHVDAECKRRIIVALGADSFEDAIAKQVNAFGRAALAETVEDQEEAAEIARKVHAIRSAAKKLKAAKSVPTDFEADDHWPE